MARHHLHFQALPRRMVGLDWVGLGWVGLEVIELGLGVIRVGIGLWDWVVGLGWGSGSPRIVGGNAY